MPTVVLLSLDSCHWILACRSELILRGCKSRMAGAFLQFAYPITQAFRIYVGMVGLPPTLDVHTNRGGVRCTRNNINPKLETVSL